MRITVPDRVRIQSRYFWEANRNRISIVICALSMILGGIAVVAWVDGSLRVAGICGAICAAGFIVDDLINNLGGRGAR